MHCNKKKVTAETVAVDVCTDDVKYNSKQNAHGNPLPNDDSNCAWWKIKKKKMYPQLFYKYVKL